MGFIVKKRSLSSNILMLIIILHRNSNYLGAGNHLVIHDSIREEFMKKSKKLSTPIFKLAKNSGRNTKR